MATICGDDHPQLHDTFTSPPTISIFSATGDLAARLLYPALYQLDCDGRIEN